MVQNFFMQLTLEIKKLGSSTLVLNPGPPFRRRVCGLSNFFHMIQKCFQKQGSRGQNKRSVQKAALQRTFWRAFAKSSSGLVVKTNIPNQLCFLPKGLVSATGMVIGQIWNHKLCSHPYNLELMTHYPNISRYMIRG